MTPLKRTPANKSNDAKKFENNSYKTKAANVKPTPMRGGIRL